MDDLSSDLIQCNTGCMVGHKKLNHLMYVDDLVLFSLSASGLRDLISICSQYGETHDINYNPKQRVCMTVRGHKRVVAPYPVFTLKQKLLQCVDNVRYISWLYNYRGLV
jgi:hypothetical protein